MLRTMQKNNIPTSSSSNELGRQQAVTIDQLLTCLADCGDVRRETHLFGPCNNSYKVTLIYCECLADMKQLHQYVIPLLTSLLEKADSLEHLNRNNPLTLQPILPTAGIQDVEATLFSGQLIMGIEQENLLYSVNIANPPNRSPEESNTEISIKGPKDGFTEDLSMNIALIRKRMRTRSLKCENYTIGVRSQTKVSLMYVSDIMNPDILNEVRQRLQKIDTDAVVSSSQLGEALGDSKYALFPLLDYIGRPDYVVQSLVRGRFIIIVEGTPMVLIGPANLLLTLKSPEDIHFPYFFVAFQRILRFIGLFISIFMPGIWISLIAFNLEQLPFSLLATVTITRLGLPFSAPMEMILMLGLFEIFREAGIRLPKAVGQTIAVVGGLIVGDAAIRAGLSSSTTLVVAAVTAVATFTLVNQSLSGTVSILRVFVLLASSILGMYGFILSLMTIVFYLSIQQTFGIPYLSPISPPIFKDMFVALFSLPVKILKRRPAMLNTTDDTRQGEDST